MKNGGLKPLAWKTKNRKKLTATTGLTERR